MENEGVKVVIERTITLPVPIIDVKEDYSMKQLTERYEDLIKPRVLAKAGNKVSSIIPDGVKQKGVAAKDSITKQELFSQCMKVVATGFSVIEKQAAKMAVSENDIVAAINGVSKNTEISSIEEICLARGYDIAKTVNKYKTHDMALALVEGGATGFFGFAGLPYNMVLSTFLYYRAVQSIAMYYGYDVKNNAFELVIASDVFMNALSPEDKGANQVTSTIGKIMVMTEVTTLKQMSNKTWTQMASKGGASLLICQMRALANKAARDALQKAGQKGLEDSLFRGVFEQIGRRLTKKAVGNAMPGAGAIIGALFDTAQMSKVLEYADVFYNKRFLLEKEIRINMLLGYDGDEDPAIIDVAVDDLEETLDLKEE